MKHTELIPILITLLVLAIPAEGRIKCWTNKDGVRECGDAIPPEYSQKKHEVLNEQGLVIERGERAKTEEEIADEKRQAELQAQQAKLDAEREREDTILLQTFSKVEDIEAARDHKINAIESAIALAERRNETIRENLNQRVAQAAADERAGREPSQPLIEDIRLLQRQIKTNNTFIRDKRMEQKTVREAYEQDIKRYNELKSASAD